MILIFYWNRYSQYLTVNVSQGMKTSFRAGYKYLIPQSLVLKLLKHGTCPRCVPGSGAPVPDTNLEVFGLFGSPLLSSAKYS